MKTLVIAVLVLLLPIVVPAAAPATQPTPKAAERAKVLKDNIKTFRLDLGYHGDQDKPYYGMTLSMQPIQRRRSSMFDLAVQISEAQAGKVIDHLASEGFLDQAIDAAFKELPAPPTPCYTLILWSGEGAARQELYGILGWGLPMLKRLDGLRGILDGDAAKQMDTLLGRLSGHRREWESASITSFVAGIKAILPKGWECSVISEPGKMGHPHGLDEPLFRMDFTNPNESFETDLAPAGKQQVHPSMRLHFHPIHEKVQIMKTIEAEKRFSWDIPICFSETKDFLIVTSPPWINGGCYTEEAQKLIAPLEQALKAAITKPSALSQTPASELVKKLSDPSNEVRAEAAAAVRQILPADPAAAPNCHEKAYWERRIEPLKAGTPLKEALNVLLPDMTEEQRQKAMEGGDWSGQSGVHTYRLDDYWTVRLQLGDFGHEKLLEPPALVRSVKRVWVEPPADYTGTWVTWHVNGQKADEIQYVNGKYDGTFTAFYDDGSRCYEQHYKQHGCDGTDTGYYRSGKKSYEGVYKNGKQVGTWRWFSEDGKVTSVQEHGDGQQ